MTLLKAKLKNLIIALKTARPVPCWTDYMRQTR